MEQGTNNSKRSLFVAEFGGTAVFLIAIFFTAFFQTDPLTTAIGVGGGLFIAIMTFGKETGGHFNPAVSTGYFLFFVNDKKRYLNNFLILVTAQFLGGLFSGLVLFATSAKIPTLLPDEAHIAGSILDEIIFTFIFLLVIYCVKSRYAAATKDGVLGALTVSMTLSFTVLYGGKISGACYNPAVGLALNLWAAWTNKDAEYLQYLYLYIFCPLLGGILSGATVKFYLNKRILDALKEDEVKKSADVYYMENIDEAGTQENQSNTDEAKKHQEFDMPNIN